MRGSIVAAGMLAVLCAGTAKAGTVITTTQGGVNDAKTQTIMLDDDKLLMSTPRGAILYRGDQQKFFMINDSRRSYMEMSPDSLQKMQSGAMAMMQQRMAQMPEAQRKQIEAMMASRGMPGMTMGQTPQQAETPATYQPAGAPRKVGQWTCTPFAEIRDGKPGTEICVVKLSEVGLSRADLKPFDGLSAMATKMSNGMGPHAVPMATMDFDSLNKSIGFEGFPVQTIRKSPSGQVEFESTVQSIEHKTVAAGTFDVPAGYTKREMGGPMAGGGE